MAYRRRQQEGMAYPSSVLDEEDDPHNAGAQSPFDFSEDSSSSSSSSLAAKAIRASSAYRDSSLSSAYAGHRAVPQSPTTATNSPASRYAGLGFNTKLNLNSNPNPIPSYSSQGFPKDAKTYEYSSMNKLTEPKQGFWGSLARKAKSIIDDDNDPLQSNTPPGRTTMKAQIPDTGVRGNLRHQYPGPDKAGESRERTENPTLHRGYNALTSSINYISGTIGNALEEGISIVENRTSDIIQETRKHIKKKTVNSEAQKQAHNSQPPMQADLELQLKASRDVAMAMAAKAKLLLRELKTVKADFAFAKERCAQLEEENKVLRENRERGDNPEDDDLIRLQLETLLAEKSRLAHENSVYARENRFLREVVEYHQLTMQDVVYLDEGSEEVTEVYPTKVMGTNP